VQQLVMSKVLAVVMSKVLAPRCDYCVR
jgi:hypothetical protein